MRKLICKVCGNEYETDSPHSKYCSLVCKDIARKRIRSEWETQYKNEHNGRCYSTDYLNTRRRALKRLSDNSKLY